MLPIFDVLMYNRHINLEEALHMARGGFQGFSGGNNMQQLMRQAQKLQQQALEMTEQLDAMEYTGKAGGGAVTCTVNGKREVLSLKINKDVIDPEDPEMLEDIVMAAINDALKQGEENREAQMNKLSGATGMGGLF